MRPGPLSLGLLLAACLCTRAGAQDARAVDEAVERGLRWLEGRQRFDGAFQRDPRTGRTALVTYALLKSGRRPQDRAPALALAHLEGAPAGGTYDQAFLALARSAAGAAVQPESLQRVVDTLLGVQARRGAWAYPEGEEDLSNTQVAALALHAASRAGAEVPRSAWRRLGDATLEFGRGDGGFGYRREGGASSGSMTAAGVGTLAICAAALEGDSSQARVLSRWESARTRGLDWLGGRFTVQANPGGGGWLLYYLYGLERVGDLLGLERIGTHDWYREGAERLLGLQQPDGSWNGSLDDTSFALLFLRRATRSVTGTEARRERVVHATDEGGILLRGTGVDPVQVWLASVQGEALDRYAWPGERGEGLRIARLVWMLDGRVAKDLRGDARKPHGTERFPLELEELAPGEHTLQARLQVLVPRAGREPVLRLVESGVLRFTSPGGMDPHWLQSARDAGLDLSRRGQASVNVTSEGPRHPASAVLDDDPHTHWLASGSDEAPTLEIEFDEPVPTREIALTQPFTWPLRPGALTRALEAEVRVNGGRALRVQMYPDERRKGRLVLPQAMLVRRLEIRLTAWVPGPDGKARPGLAEVQLFARD